MMITKCQVLRPESRGPGAGTRDSVNILEITESQLPSSSCQDSGLPAPGSQESGLSDLQYVHLSEINKCAGNPESRQPELGSWDSVNILEITDSQLLSSGCRDSGLPAPGSRDAGVGTRCRQPGVPAAGTRELGVGDLQNVHQLPAPEFWLPGLRVAGTWESGLGTRDSSQVPGAGNPESQQPELRSRESVNILEITESQVPSPGSQNLGVGDLQNVNILEITNSRLPSSGCRDSGSPAPDTQDSVCGTQNFRLEVIHINHICLFLKDEHIGDHRVVTPNSRVPAAGTPGCRHPGVGSRESQLGDLQNVHLSEITNVNILEITDSQLPTPGCRQPGVPAAGTQESGVTTW
ncbi:hypothetical protein F4604DRAFT_1690730 [Suillus subluteus]|nr:hypothetical protein F4604DRAFT_1690730 [Suillus subluteus]